MKELTSLFNPSNPFIIPAEFVDCKKFSQGSDVHQLIQILIMHYIIALMQSLHSLKIQQVSHVTKTQC